MAKKKLNENWQKELAKDIREQEKCEAPKPQEKCEHYNYPADWVNNGWKCLNCGKIIKCNIGGDNVKCCPNAPHPKPQEKEGLQEFCEWLEGKYHQDWEVERYVEVLIVEARKEGWNECMKF